MFFRSFKTVNDIVHHLVSLNSCDMDDIFSLAVQRSDVLGSALYEIDFHHTSLLMSVQEF